MTRRIAVLRPEPGNSATAARVAAFGLVPLQLPLFAVNPIAWQPPDLLAFDALLVTSANAIRHGGTALAGLRGLPVYAVGEATAAAARDAGFHVAATGVGNVEEIVALAVGKRLLHLAGRDHRAWPGTPVVIVYASDPLPIDAERLTGTVALAHSPRAARRLAELVDPGQISLAAISQQTAAAAGPGWQAIAVAEVPTDDALIAAARRLAD